MTYHCPICGYDELTQPPENFSICPCCGTEFGNDDFDRSHADLRQEWIAKGTQWFSRSTLRRKNWNAYRQLIRAGFGVDLVNHHRMNDDVNYRYEVNKAFSEVDIAKQLRALRERVGATQSQLAATTDMKQSRISELEGMNYSSWSISTLERLAKGLGVAFTYSFITWDELVSRIGRFKGTLPSPSIERAQAVAPEPAPVLSSQQGYAYQHRMAALKMFGLLSKENIVSMEQHKQNRRQLSDDENSQKQQRDAATLSYSATAKTG